MKLMNRKTRKAIRKSVQKVIRQHGPEIIAGIAAAVASAVATLASTEAAGSTDGKKSNLGKLSDKVAGALSLANDKGARGKRRREDGMALPEEPASGPGAV